MEAIEDLELKKNDIDLIGKDKFIEYEHKIAYLEKKAKRFSL